MQSMPSRLASRTVLAVFAAACATTTSLAQMSPVAYVDSQGREWRQLDSTTGKSWYEVAEMCPVDGATPCTGMINNQDITGWVWATREQVEELLYELGASVGAFDCTTGPYVDGAVFGYFLSTTNFDLMSLADGWSSTAWDTAKGGAYAYAPRVGLDQDTQVAWTCVRSLAPRDQTSTDRGVWLFRPRCEADLNNDGTVGPADLSVLLGSWGAFGAADLDGNGVVGAEDLSIMLAAWGSGNC
jgi:hypothetical protein